MVQTLKQGDLLPNKTKNVFETHTGDFPKEIDERVSATFRSFWAMKKLLISELPMFHKCKLMNSVVLPTLTYGAQSWTLTQENERRLITEQKAMESRLLKISLLDHRSNDKIVQYDSETFIFEHFL